MTLTKKQAAQLCLDAIDSERKLKQKVIIVVINIIVISIAITFLTSWYFGLACCLSVRCWDNSLTKEWIILLGLEKY